MKRVWKKYFYHISRSNEWSMGQNVVVGKMENDFWRMCKQDVNRVVFDGIEMSVFELINLIENDELNISFDVTRESVEFLFKNLSHVAKESALYKREQTFEEVRKKYHHKLPSRQKCLWVCDEKNLEYWKMACPKGKTLLTLELTGKIFCGDNGWLITDTLSNMVYEERARHYWNGEMLEGSPKEYLFCGKATVKKIEQL